jgi:hypothetical protein
MQAAAEQIPVVSSPVARRKAQLCTLSALDGRTVAARRARELAKGFEAELGGTVTVSRRFAIERAAALVALAEDAKARRLAGDAAITLEDVVRVDNAAARAVKALGIKPGAPAKVPTLQEHLARRAAALAGEQTVSAAPEHAIEDADLFAPAMARGADWGAWKTYVRALFGLPLSDAQMPLFTQCTGRTERPAGGFSESALICGRRSRKSFTMAMTGLYLAAFHDFSRWLGSGEKGVVLICAPDKKQCRTIFIHGLLEAPLLANMVARKTADSIELTNGIVIEVVPASFKSVRGYAILAALIDECAFLPVDEGAADPDHALLDAIRPAMASIPIAKLIIASSPYARRGVLWEAYQRHWARTMRPCSSGRPRPMS